MTERKPIDRIGVYRTVTRLLGNREEKLKGAQILRKVLNQSMGYLKARRTVHAEVLHATATHTDGQYAVCEVFGKPPDCAAWVFSGNRNQIFFTAIAGATMGLLSHEDLVLARSTAGEDRFLLRCLREAEKQNNAIAHKQRYPKSKG